MNAKLIFFGLIIVGAVLEIAGDYFFKKWSLGARNSLFIAGLAIYFIGSVFWAISLKYGDLSKAISLFTVLNVIILVIMGIFLFGEKLTLVNKAGILLGIISIILIQV